MGTKTPSTSFLKLRNKLTSALDSYRAKGSAAVGPGSRFRTREATLDIEITGVDGATVG
jgi:hypothetical protein